MWYCITVKSSTQQIAAKVLKTRVKTTWKTVWKTINFFTRCHLSIGIIRSGGLVALIEVIHRVRVGLESGLVLI